MMLVCNTGGKICSNYITQDILSSNFNRRLYHYHHHHHSSHFLSSSVTWKYINMNGKGNGNGWSCCEAISGMGMLAAAAVLSTPPPSEDFFSNIPQQLSGKTCESKDKECNKENMKNRIQRPKSRNAESCTTKCVGTCIRGGEGSPGEGPLNVRRYCQ